MQTGIRTIEYKLLDRLTPLELKVYQNPKTSAGTAKVLETLARERALSADLIDALRIVVDEKTDAQALVSAALRARDPKPARLTTAQYEDYIARAREQYGDEGSIEIDEGARVSAGNDDGAYVEAWVWVDDV